jgi:hypothetical protein
MLRLLRSGALLALLLSLLILPAFAGGKGGHKRNPNEEKITDRGSINWQKGVLYATGLGAISRTDSNEARAYLRARTFAKLDALRNLLMVIDHVRIDSHTVGSDFTTASDEIRAEVKGIVRGAQVVGERRIPIGTSMMVEVTVATPLYGDQGIATIFVPEMMRRQQEADENQPGRSETPAPESRAPDTAPEPDDSGAPLVHSAPPPPDVPAPAAPEPQDTIQRQDSTQPPAGDRYTSVIIDTRGFNVWRCMSPKIRHADGSEVWGTVRVDPDYVIEHGIVIYAHTIEEAKHLDRAGDRPVVIRAVGKNGGKFGTDPVLSEADAERLLSLNARDRFMDRFRVIFVVDQGL